MSKFIISLDFELKWGVLDAYDEKYDKNLLAARQVIPKILCLFEEYKIKATWAIVGLLFNSTKEEYYKYKPLLEPSYNADVLNPYLENIGESEDLDKIHYAASLVKLIYEWPGQEVGSHTYSHYNCKDKLQTNREFDSDIKSVVKIASEKYNMKISSFVFPKNEINEEYLDVIKKHEFTHYRGNPKNMIYSKGHNSKNIIFRMFRFLDSYFNITWHQVSSAFNNHFLVNVVGNRLLRPYSSYKILNKLMLNRIKQEMHYAAKHNKNYHLWWHPHNFGVNSDDNLNNLKDILNNYQLMYKKYNMRSVCMSEI